MSLQPAIPWWLLATLAVLVVAVLVLLRPRRYVLLIAAALLLAAASRPVIGGGEHTVMRVAGEQAPNVFVIVDRSADMSVPDGSGRTRMDTARDDIAALVDRHPEARFAVISFDARPSLDWPLSADSWSLRHVLAAAMPYARTTEATTNAGAASNVLRYQLIGARGQYPQARNLVYYLGAGAPGSTVRQREFRVPDKSVDGGAVIGYDPAGAPSLRAAADQIGVPYVPRGQDQPDEVASDDAQPGRPSAVIASSAFEVYWAPAGAAGLLILFQLYHALRDLRRTRLDRIAVGR
ncbi:MAG: VWA domain-containing protein [Mycobacterium sp.]